MSTVSIYVIGPQSGPPYKVGYTGDLRARLSTIQTGQAVDMAIHYSQETSEENGRIIERLIHKQIAHHRVRGEWFDITLEQLVAEIQFAFITWDNDDLALRHRHNLLVGPGQLG